MPWNKARQRSHCLYTFGLLIALLGEFPEGELDKPNNVYLLRSCASLHNLLLECTGLCGVTRLTKPQRKQADTNTLAVVNEGIFKSMEREYLQFSRHRLDLYGWIICWQCGYWAAQDSFKMCKSLQTRPLTWKVLKESLENIDQYLESYEEQFPYIQEDGWELYEEFLKRTTEKQLKVRP